jgi:hypothetical protein
MNRFKQSGFGVTVAISVSSLALYRMTEAAVWYVKLRGATCGTGRMLVANDFFFSGFLMTFAFIGYAIACNSRYGITAARCAFVSGVAAWLFLLFAAML